LSRGNGYEVICWIEINAHRLGPMTIHIHTANSGARPKMEDARDSILDFWSQLHK
jgi:hypothetical protein